MSKLRRGSFGSGSLWCARVVVRAGAGTMTATAILLKQKKDREEKRKEEEK